MLLACIGASAMIAAGSAGAAAARDAGGAAGSTAMQEARRADTIAHRLGMSDPHCHPPTIVRPWLDSRQSPECRALEAVAALTPDEKIYFEGGGFGLFGASPSGAHGAGHAAAESAARKLGLPVLGGGSDGPNGIADISEVFGQQPAPRSLHVTAFPTVITLAASWDRDLARRFGSALAEEFRGKGLVADLGPTLNILRTWHWGRSAETFGEDPFLTGELATAEVRALQGGGVIATLKHFAANNQEFSRTGAYPDMAGIDEHIPEKALQEIYFPHFEAAIERGGAGAVMCAYDQVNGQFSCDNRQLLGQLRRWGFDGTIVPDAEFAQRDAVAAARAGVDGASPVDEVAAAVERGKLDAHHFDRKIYHTLVTRFRLGLYEHPRTGRADAVVSTPAHVQLAREIAEAGAVLLRNAPVPSHATARGSAANGRGPTSGDDESDAAHPVLPIGPGVRSIAVIGADAGPEAVIMETGSAHVHIGALSVPLDAIRARAGRAVHVDYERGSIGVRALPLLPAQVLSPPGDESEGAGDERRKGRHVAHGLRAEYFGTPYFWVPVLTRIDSTVDTGADPHVPSPPAGTLGKREFERGREPWSARWTGTLTPPADGLYGFSLTGSGTAELYVDDRLVATIQRADFPRTVVGTIELHAGGAVPILIKYDTASSILGTGLRVGWQPPDDRLARAVAAARKADVAIVFAGEQLGEGYDKMSFPLPGDQNRLIEAVAAANPRTVVVLHTSTAVAMPWIDRVAAVIEAWYPGEEAGASIAAVLFGDVNPSGRLPVTFPRDAHQGPATHWWEYPGNGRSVVYGEGVLVGYRWYDARGEKPLFPFGHGLSYTTFAYSDLKVSGAADGRSVSIRVRNTGRRAGAEVVQLYVGLPTAADDPPRQLKGFVKVPLRPGEQRTVSLPLPDAALRAFDADSGRWRLFPGTYAVMIGASSRDIRERASFELTGVKTRR